ncbi:FHA domain-containing protein [Algisphaera agarilytica]|uniref:Putative component of type VI protein secretion system n=1 Tax=Algisphaera agarilytica TaxID=1385975 RepID=A0A7X0LJ64_9BACT|nr:FHA domain-containing protein [Algisphaera agarilytica]MBB6428522.1 putative component of type VI protein secretion system [Algisphaera agarilytica]
MEASLVMFKADGTRRDFPLRAGSLVIGRKNSCELRIPLSSVSRQHCEITVSGEQVKLRDLGSSNGTYHNSIRVQEAELSAGDEVVVGPVVFTLVVDGVPADINPVRTIVASASSHDSGATVSPEQPLAARDAEVAVAADAQADDSMPTVDLGDDDNDPFEALEAMAQEEQAQRSPGDSGSSIIEFDFDDLDDDD